MLGIVEMWGNPICPTPNKPYLLLFSQIKGVAILSWTHPTLNRLTLPYQGVRNAQVTDKHHAGMFTISVSSQAQCQNFTQL